MHMYESTFTSWSGNKSYSWILSSLAQPLDCAMNVDQRALGTQSNPTGWLCQTRSYHDSHVYITHLTLVVLVSCDINDITKIINEIMTPFSPLN